MRTGCIAAVLAAWCACGAAAAHAYEPERFAVSLHLLVDRSITPRFDTRVLEKEASSIWRPYGVQLEWTDARDSDEGANGFALDVRLEPRIQGAELPQWSTVLGRAFVNLDKPGWRPIRVSVDATEDVLMHRRGRWSSVRIVDDGDLARALGRVLAHELGHVLLGAPYHDDEGLMRAVYRPDELAEPDRALFRLTCIDVARLNARLRVLTGDPRFARRRGWTPAEAVEDSYGIDGQELRAQCIPGRTVR